MSIKEKIERYFLGYIQKDISDDEKRRFAELINNESNKPELDACFYKVWNETEERLSKEKIASSFSKLKREIDISTDNAQLSKTETDRSTMVLKNLLKYAAIIIIAFTIGLLSRNYIQFNNAVEEITFNEFVVPYGSKSELLLPDGTKIWVNSGSKVRYPVNFSATNREIYLEGEAYFDVKKDPSNPFLVKTSDLLIRVLGTSFNIKSYPDEKAIETTLVTGSLEILKNSGVPTNKVALRLEPNQKADFSKETGKVTLFKQEAPKDKPPSTVLESQNLVKKQTKLAPIPIEFVEQYTAWKDQKLVLVDNTFDEVIKKMERWYGVQIVMQSNYLSNGTFNGTFEKETLEQALKALKLATPRPFKYTIDKNIVRITGTN